MTAITWTSGISGLWSAASNWSPAQVPEAGDDVLVTQPGSYTISGVNSSFINSLTLDGADAVINLGTALFIGGNLAIIAGTLEAADLMIGGGLSNTGTLLNTGDINISGTVTSASLERIGGSGALNVFGTVLNTDGTLDGTQLGSQHIDGLGTILGGTVVNLTDSGFTAKLDGVTWQGTLEASPSLQIADGLTMTGVGGTGVGTLIPFLPGLPSTLEFTNNQTFDNAVVLGPATITADATLELGSNFSLSAPASPAPNAAVLTLGGDTIFNHGTIHVSSQQSVLTNFTNNGSISVQAADFENFGTIDASDVSAPQEQLPPGFVYSAGVMTTSITGTSFINHASGVIETGQSAGVAIVTVAATTAFTNDGTLLTQDAAPTSIEGGTIDIAAMLNGSGTIELAGSGMVKLEGAAAGTQSIDFAGRGELVLEQPALVPSVINDFSVGDTIDLGVAATGVSYTSGDLHMQMVGGSTFDLAVTGTHSFADFAINTQSDSTVIQLACFAAGTRLATARGMVAVEALRNGDAMLLADRDGSLPVVWIGHRDVDCRRHPAPRDVWPIRVAAGAFAAGVPNRDLYLSPDHAVFARGALIPVKYLVNGVTIAQVARDYVSYWHVELPRHAVLLAEGLSVESLLPGSDRAGFANGGGVVSLHPAWAWEARGSAPLAVTGPELAAVRSILARRAQSIGMTRRRRAH